MLVAGYVTRLQRKQLGGQKRHWSFLVKGFLLNSYCQKEDCACDLATEFLKNKEFCFPDHWQIQPKSFKRVFKQECTSLSLWNQAPFTELTSHLKSQLRAALLLSD